VKLKKGLFWCKCSIKYWHFNSFSADLTRKDPTRRDLESYRDDGDGSRWNMLKKGFTTF
jgi:hypothetical protein